MFEKAEVYLSQDEEQMINRAVARAFGTQYNSSISRKYRLLKDRAVVRIGNLEVEGIAFYRERIIP